VFVLFDLLVLITKITIAILKINGEKLLQIQDDGGFLKYVCVLCPSLLHN
jgi:hypothetical protein